MPIRRCSGLSTRKSPPKLQKACPPSDCSPSWSTSTTRLPRSASSAVATSPARPAPRRRRRLPWARSCHPARAGRRRTMCRMPARATAEWSRLWDGPAPVATVVVAATRRRRLCTAASPTCPCISTRVERCSRGCRPSCPGTSDDRADVHLPTVRRDRHGADWPCSRRWLAAAVWTGVSMGALVGGHWLGGAVDALGAPRGGWRRGRSGGRDSSMQVDEHLAGRLIGSSGSRR